MSPNSFSCDSRIDRVVVYARGAVVTRRVLLPDDLPADAVELCVQGVTALAEAGSVRALVDGDREVKALKTRLAIPGAGAAPGSLAQRLREIDLARISLEAELAGLRELRDALAATTLDPALSRWARRIDPGARFGDALALGGLVGAELARLDERIRALGPALDENRRAREAAAIAAAQGTAAELEGEDRARLEVLVRLGAGSEALRALDVSYVVGAARWWPAYTARFTAAATRVTIGLDAFVAQASGEDWDRVKLSVSTADLTHDARLPELRSLRFGRAQPPVKRGYRPPPDGLELMFEGYDRAVAESEESTRSKGAKAGRAGLDPSTETVTRAPADKPKPVAYDTPTLTGSTAQEAGGGGAALRALAEMEVQKARLEHADRLEAAPRQMAHDILPPMMARKKSAGLFSSFGSSVAEMPASISTLVMDAGSPPPEPEEPAAIEPADAWLDFDALVLVELHVRAHRGRLSRDPAARDDPRAQGARRGIDGLAGPKLSLDPLADRGRFDHRYDAGGTSDVPSSGRPHRVAVASAEAAATPRFVAVPREAPEVYREVAIENPFAAPLLGGPVDVFIDGALMTTSQISFVDRSGIVHLGLGVEERLRVARNARVEEGTAGLLGGSAAIDHSITIDLRSSLGQKVTVDVLDRIPVSDEKDVDVRETFSRPEHEKYTQIERGSPIRRGLRWRIEVPAGDKAKIEFGYRVTLPGKNEIVGGNRRE